MRRLCVLGVEAGLVDGEGADEMAKGAGGVGLGERRWGLGRRRWLLVQRFLVSWVLREMQRARRSGLRSR